MKKNSIYKRSLSLIAALSFSFSSHATPLSDQEFIVQPSGEIQLTVSERPVSDVLETLEHTLGTTFIINEGLASELVTLVITAKGKEELTRQVLSGFNWIQQDTASGQQQIFILERSGDTTEFTLDEDTTTEDLSAALTMEAEEALFTVGNILTNPTGAIPEALAAYPEHVLNPVELDYSSLQNLTPGDVISLNLPSGTHDVTFVELNNVDDSEASSWVGYLGDEEDHYDVIITSGEDGLFAHVNTPDGLQTIKTINGQQWWIDIANSGLDHPDQINDTFTLPTTPSISAMAEMLSDNAGAGMVADKGRMSNSKATAAYNLWVRRFNAWNKKYRGWKTRYSKTRSRRDKGAMLKYLKLVRVAHGKVRSLKKYAAKSPSSNRTRIDLLMTYTNGVSTTRMKHMVALANNAFSNSGVNIQLRIVKMLKVTYTQTNDNNIALQDLTYSKKGFSKISQLRDRYKADLVTLVRPFNYPAQDSCGIAWLGGANGSNFHPITGFSVVSDGSNNGYYCSDYTLAHEIGHNLGSAHDRVHAGAAGAYSYSYGFGQSGKAGSIMSYINPEVGRFSSPRYKCNAITCGAKNANNVTSMNKTRRIISKYK